MQVTNKDVKVQTAQKYRQTTSGGRRGDRAVAGLAIGAAAIFMAIVAVLLNSTALFYMGTGLIATIGACRLQAWLSVRGLHFDRVAPESVKVGELVTVQITAWSERRIRRPLITMHDNLPPRLLVADLSPSLPIAPAFDVPITTQYQFRPMRRGRYRWSGVIAEGTDALGMVTMQKKFETDTAQMSVLPRLIPVNLELPSSLGWGTSEATSGQSRGAGLEPRGVREYAFGDSLRHVHWRSSARSQRLLVKEFETGSNSSAAFIIQNTIGSEIGQGAQSSLELIVGNVAYLADMFLRQGARVEFPGLEPPPRTAGQRERMEEILDLLTDVKAENENTVGQILLESTGHLHMGSTVFCALSVADDSLPKAVATLKTQGISVVVLLYDAGHFDPKAKAISATSSDFIQQLSIASAIILAVPIDPTV